MKRLTYIGYLSIGMLCCAAASSCSEGDAGSPAGTEDEVTLVNHTFTVNVTRQAWGDGASEHATRALEGGLEPFAEGDRLSLFSYVNADAEDAESGMENVVDNVVNVFDGMDWIAEEEMRWKSVLHEQRILAVYPALEGKQIDLSNLKYDLSQGALMLAEVKTKPTTQAVELQLTHLFSKVDIRVLVGNEYDGGNIVVKGIRFIGKKDATINCFTREIMPGMKDGQMDLQQIGEPVNGVKRFAGVLLPQDYMPDCLRLVIEENGVEKELLPEGDLMQLGGGEQTNFRFLLGKHAVVMERIGVEEWGEGGSGGGNITQDMPY